MADFVVPSIVDVPDDRYTVVYDAEYVGFEPGKGSVVGQTVSVLHPELRSDDVFAIREQRVFGEYNGRDRTTRVQLLSRDEFLDLARTGFPKDTVVGKSLGWAFSRQHMNSSSESLTSSWPTAQAAYAKAIVCGLGASGKFGNLDLAAIKKAMDTEAELSEKVRHWNAGSGSMRGTHYTREDFMSYDEQVARGIEPDYGIPSVIKVLASWHKDELVERAEQHRQVRANHYPVSLFSYLFPSSRPVTIVPFTSPLDSFTVPAPEPAQASPADVIIDVDNKSSTYDCIRVPLKKGSRQLDI